MCELASYYYLLSCFFFPVKEPRRAMRTVGTASSHRPRSVSVEAKTFECRCSVPAADYNKCRNICIFLKKFRRASFRGAALCSPLSGRTRVCDPAGLTAEVSSSFHHRKFSDNGRGQASKREPGKHQATSAAPAGQ